MCGGERERLPRRGFDLFQWDGATGKKTRFGVNSTIVMEGVSERSVKKKVRED